MIGVAPVGLYVPFITRLRRAKQPPSTLSLRPKFNVASSLDSPLSTALSKGDIPLMPGRRIKHISSFEHPQKHTARGANWIYIL
jgi:hypothetical protein